MSYIPKFILNIIDNFSISNIAIWCTDILNYLIAPRKFVTIYNSKSLENQICQIIFYACLNCLSYFIFGAGQSQHELYRYLSIILFTSIPFIILNTITYFLVSKREFNLWKIISYSLVGNLIFFIPVPIFLHLFIENENYTFAFFSNFCFSLMFLFFLIIIWFGVFSQFRKVFFAVFLNILLFNFFYIATGLMINDSFSKGNNSSMDAIVEEFNSHGEKVSYATAKIVSYKSVTQISTTIDSSYMSLSLNDSIVNIDENGIQQFFTMLKNNERYIDSIVPKLYFKRNKEMFKLLSQYNKDVEHFLLSPKNQKYLKERTIYKNKEGTKIEFITEEYRIPKSVYVNLDLFNQTTKELEESRDFAHLPMRVIESLLFPADFVVEKFDLETDKSVYFMIK